MTPAFKQIASYGKIMESFIEMLQGHLEGENFVLPADDVNDFLKKARKAFGKVAQTQCNLLLIAGLNRKKIFGLSSEKTKRLFKGLSDEQIQFFRHLLLLDDLKASEAALVSARDVDGSGGENAPSGDSKSDGKGKSGKGKSKKKKRGPKKTLSPEELRKLHPDWRVVTYYVGLRPGERICACGAVKQRAGDRVELKVAYRAAEFYFEEIHYYTYTCRVCQGADCDREAGQANTVRTPVKAFPEPVLIRGSRASPTIVLDVIISKFDYDMPLHRTERRYACNGFIVNRNTMAHWVIAVSVQLEPLYDLIREVLRTNSLINMDETPAQVHREDGRPNTSQSYFWVAAGTGVAPVAYFHYAPSHGAAEVRVVLGPDYSGTLQTDGLSAYPAYAKASDGDVTLVSCLAHVRRKFADLIDLDGGTAQGDELTLKLFFLCGEMYGAHRTIAETPDLGPDDVVRMKHALVGPILDAMERLLNEAVKRAGGNSSDPVCAAAKYALNRLAGLRAYLDDPICTPDNNLAERVVKEIVMGRKAWLFCDSPAGARAVAIFKTLVVSARMNGLNTEKYLKYVIWNIRKADTREKLEALLPHRVDRKAYLMLDYEAELRKFETPPED